MFGRNWSLNESPSEKEGKLEALGFLLIVWFPSMKVPPKRKGNLVVVAGGYAGNGPSMKVPPKRKGNEHTSDEELAKYVPQ